MKFFDPHYMQYLSCTAEHGIKKKIIEVKCVHFLKHAGFHAAEKLYKILHAIYGKEDP